MEDPVQMDEDCLCDYGSHTYFFLNFGNQTIFFSVIQYSTS